MARQHSEPGRAEDRRQHIVGLLRRALETRDEITLAVLHGSFTKGTAYRDIDVALDHDLRTRSMRIARFRNLLVHLYARVDDGEVYRVVREDLGDLDRYLVSLGRYLETEL